MRTTYSCTVSRSIRHDFGGKITPSFEHEICANLLHQNFANSPDLKRAPACVRWQREVNWKLRRTLQNMIVLNPLSIKKRNSFDASVMVETRPWLRSRSSMKGGFQTTCSYTSNSELCTRMEWNQFKMESGGVPCDQWVTHPLQRRRRCQFQRGFPCAVKLDVRRFYSD